MAEEYCDLEYCDLWNKLTQLGADLYRCGRRKGYEEAERKFRLTATNAKIDAINENWDNAYNEGLVYAWNCAREYIEMKYKEAHDVYDAVGILKDINVYDAIKKLDEVRMQKLKKDTTHECDLLKCKCPYEDKGCYECQVQYTWMLARHREEKNKCK